MVGLLLLQYIPGAWFEFILQLLMIGPDWPRFVQIIAPLRSSVFEAFVIVKPFNIAPWFCMEEKVTAGPTAPAFMIVFVTTVWSFGSVEAMVRFLSLKSRFS